MNVTFFQWMPSRVCAAPAMVRFSTCTLSAKRRDMGGSRISAPEGMLVASRRLPPRDAGLSVAPIERMRGAPTKIWLGATLFVRAESFADFELLLGEELLADLLLPDEEFVAGGEWVPAALDADVAFAAEVKGVGRRPAVREASAGDGLLGGAVAPVAVATSSSSMLTDDGVPGGTGSIAERSSASAMRASVTCAVSRELVW